MSAVEADTDLLAHEVGAESVAEGALDDEHVGAVEGGGRQLAIGSLVDTGSVDDLAVVPEGEALVSGDAADFEQDEGLAVGSTTGVTASIAASIASSIATSVTAVVASSIAIATSIAVASVVSPAASIATAASIVVVVATVSAVVAGVATVAGARLRGRGLDDGCRGHFGSRSVRDDRRGSAAAGTTLATNTVLPSRAARVRVLSRGNRGREDGEDGQELHDD